MRARRFKRVWFIALGVALLVNLGSSSAIGCEYLQKFGGESSGAGRLSAPRDVAIDASGNAWVADTTHKRVQKFNSSGEFVSQFGVSSGVSAIDLDAGGDIWVAGGSQVREYSSSGELKLSFGSLGEGNGQFVETTGIAVDASGNVFVVEKLSLTIGFGASRVQKFNSKGEYLSQFGKSGSGNGEFKSPEAIAVDSEGNILVADTNNNRYQEFTPAGAFVRSVGSKGTGNGQFESPRGITVDSEGRVWVADSKNNRLQRFSAKGAYQTQFGAYGPNDGQFVEPRGIAISGTSIWVADTGNDRVQKFNSSGEYLQKFGGESSGAGRLSAPRDVAIDASGNAWVADTAHSRMQKFNSSGEFVSQFGVKPAGNALEISLVGPTGVALDSEGNVWTASPTKIRKYKTNGELLLEFGAEGEGNGQFIAARDLAIDASGNIWVIDAGVGF